MEFNVWPQYYCNLCKSVASISAAMRTLLENIVTSPTVIKIIFLLIEMNFFAKILALPPVIRIGAVFNDDLKNSPSEVAFKYAVHSINRDKGILPDTTLVYDIQTVSKHDSFHACKKVCAQVKKGVQAIFGPSDANLGAHVHSICDALDIPHLETRIDMELAIKEFSINLHPAQNYINQAFLDVIHYLNWTKVGILFEKHCGVIHLREMVRTPGLEIHVRQVNPATYVKVLNELKHKEIHNIIIDTNSANVSMVLKGILQLQMNEYKYHYLFTSFDIETFDLDDFKYNFVNITSFRLVDVDDVGVKEILKDMERFKHESEHETQQNFRKVRTIEIEPALIYDSVYIFAIGLQTLEQSHTLRISNISCASESPWDGGLSLINYINAVEWKGLTGPIQFKEGRRIQFKLDLVKLKQHSIVKVGEWSPQTRLNITDRSIFFDAGSMNVTLVVITILETPYVMMHYGKNFTGNERFFGFCVDILNLVAQDVGFDYILDLVPDRKYGAKDPITGEWNGMVAQLMKYEKPYVMQKSIANSSLYTANSNYSVDIVSIDPSALYEGFCIDMLRLIADKVGFDYSIELVPDGKYGVYNQETQEWNGIVRQLMDKKADLAVGSMTINYARESVIDFTKPFMNLGISILFKVPTTPPSRLFSFMNPLAFEIWLYVLAAYFLVSITIYTVAKFSPFEWRDTHPCDIQNQTISNQFTMANSLWFTIGTLMQQGSDLNPKAASTRIVSAIWWFFTLIIISSYTANLAAFLTVERMITPVENADDLASQTEISYGTLESGSTMTFFRDSMIETYRKMWRFMDNKKPSVFTTTYEEGIKRVLEGNYAFLMESTMLDYTVHRDCNLTQIGGLLDTKGYGIATPMGSPWRDKISLAILELQEKGEIQMLYDKWWKNSGETCIRKDKSKQSKANALGLDNIGGVFVVLLCGLAIAVCVAIVEFCQFNRKYTQAPIGSYGAYDADVVASRGGSMMAVNARSTNDDAIAVGAQHMHAHAQQDCVKFGSGVGGIVAYGRGMQKTLCAEMTDEFCFALRCMGSRQRPLLKRRCSRCISLQSMSGFDTGSRCNTLPLGGTACVSGGHSHTHIVHKAMVPLSEIPMHCKSSGDLHFAGFDIKSKSDILSELRAVAARTSIMPTPNKTEAPEGASKVISNNYIKNHTNHNKSLLQLQPQQTATISDTLYSRSSMSSSTASTSKVLAKEHQNLQHKQSNACKSTSEQNNYLHQTSTTRPTQWLVNAGLGRLFGVTTQQKELEQKQYIDQPPKISQTQVNIQQKLPKKSTSFTLISSSSSPSSESPNVNEQHAVSTSPELLDFS